MSFIPATASTKTDDNTPYKFASRTELYRRGNVVQRINSRIQPTTMRKRVEKKTSGEFNEKIFLFFSISMWLSAVVRQMISAQWKTWNYFSVKQFLNGIRTRTFSSFILHASNWLFLRHIDLNWVGEQFEIMSFCFTLFFHLSDVSVHHSKKFHEQQQQNINATCFDRKVTCSNRRLHFAFAMNFLAAEESKLNW